MMMTLRISLTVGLVSRLFGRLGCRLAQPILGKMHSPTRHAPHFAGNTARSSRRKGYGRVISVSVRSVAAGHALEMTTTWALVEASGSENTKSSAAWPL